MILTTTPSVQGRSLVEYKGVVFGDVPGTGNGMLMVTDAELD